MWLEIVFPRLQAASGSCGSDPGRLQTCLRVNLTPCCREAVSEWRGLAGRPSAAWAETSWALRKPRLRSLNAVSKLDFSASLIWYFLTCFYFEGLNSGLLEARTDSLMRIWASGSAGSSGAVCVCVVVYVTFLGCFWCVYWPSEDQQASWCSRSSFY